MQHDVIKPSPSTQRFRLGQKEKLDIVSNIFPFWRKRDAEKRKAELPSPNGIELEKRIFYDAVIISCKAVIGFAERYVYLAEQMAAIIASGANTIQVFNDEAIVKGFLDAGFSKAEARNYIITGCVQPIPAATYGSVCAAHSENGHVVFGFVTGATPDGRKQMEPYSIGAAGGRGREKKGYTAALKSFSKINPNEIIARTVHDR